MQEHCRRNELTDVCEIMGKVARVRPHIERNSVENRLVYKLVFYFFGKEYYTSIARFGVRTYPENNAF